MIWKILFDICKKNIQVDSILLRLSIEGFKGKTFFVWQYKVNGMAEIFCKNVKVKGHNQSQDVLLVDIWKLQ